MVYHFTSKDFIDVTAVAWGKKPEGFRINQAIFDALPSWLANELVGTKYDFYYWDNERVDEVFVYLFSKITTEVV